MFLWNYIVSSIINNVFDQQAKHLQFVSGVHVTSYWLATFAWDLLNVLVPVFVSFVLFAAFQVEGYTGQALGGIFLLLVSSIVLHC